MAEKRMEKISQNTEVSTTELATILGLTARRVQQMAQDGTIATVQRGRFALCEVIQQYIDFQTKGKTRSNGDLEKEKLEAEASIKKSKAVIAELEVKEVQGTMHRSEDVADMTADLLYAVRGALLALPGRLAVDAAGIDDAAEISELIRKEVYSVMQDVSQYEYDPEKYKERVRERMKWSGAEHKSADDEDG